MDITYDYNLDGVNWSTNKKKNEDENGGFNLRKK